MDDTELLSILADAGDGLDPGEQGRGTGWDGVHEHVTKLLAERNAQAVEISRLRAGLELIAVPPYEGAENPGCVGCSEVAQATLNGIDYQTNAAQLQGGYPLVFGDAERGILVSLLNAELVAYQTAEPGDTSGLQLLRHLRNRIVESKRDRG